MSLSRFISGDYALEVALKCRVDVSFMTLDTN